jgi:hypothetical protein
MKKLLILLLLLIVAYLAWRWWRRSDGTPADHGQALLYDRVWLDHVPRSPTDTTQLFVAITDQPLGAFQKASQWKGEYELFRYEPRGDGQMELLFPQTRDKQRLSYRAWKCNEAKFDFCLEMSGGKGVRKYYSQRGWEVGSVAAGRQLGAHLSPAD